MDDQELAFKLGEIKAGVDENGRRLDRHNAIHVKLEATVKATELAVAVIKGSAALIATIISIIIGAVGWVVFIWRD